MSYTRTLEREEYDEDVYNDMLLGILGVPRSQVEDITSITITIDNWETEEPE